MKEVNVKVLIPDDVDPKKVIDLSLVVRYQKENDKWQFVTMPFALTDSAENKGEWILISEDNLPEDFQKVLITIERYDGSKVVREAEYHENPSSGRKTFRVFANNERWEVGEEGLIAWMPKPEPYKAESEGTE